MLLPRLHLTRGRLLLVSAALLLLLAVCVCPAEAKGGRGGGKRGKGGGGGILFLYDYLPWYLEIPAYILILCLIMASPYICVVVCVCCCVCFGCLEDEDEELEKSGMVKCRLCDEKVTKEAWEDGSHRRMCQEVNQSLLSNLPILNNLSCEKCNKNMPLWPKEKGNNFMCQSEECEKKGEKIDNNGRNQIRCYMCDVVLCLTCANKRQEAARAGFAETTTGLQGQPEPSAPSVGASSGWAMPYPPPAGDTGAGRDTVIEMQGVNSDFQPSSSLRNGRDDDGNVSDVGSGQALLPPPSYNEAVKA